MKYLSCLKKEGKNVPCVFPQAQLLSRLKINIYFGTITIDFFSKHKKRVAKHEMVQGMRQYIFTPQIDVVQRVTFVLNSNINSKIRNFFFWRKKR